jgi:hypothetical protein
MKLAKVEHIRCDDPIATSYLMVPDELSEEELASAADRANQAWWRAAQTFAQYNAQPRGRPASKVLDDFRDDLTIRQAKLLWEAAERERKELEERWREAQVDFTTLLRREIPGSEYIEDFPALEATCHWGHGTKIIYGGELPNDIRGSA